MLLNRNFFELADIVGAFVPQDMSAAALTGLWVSMANADRCLAVVYKAAGSTTENPKITCQQATSAAGAGAKALTFSRLATKIGNISTVSQWTVATQTASTDYTDATGSTKQAIYAIEIKSTDLDMANGFKFMNVSTGDVGVSAQLGCAFYILFGLRYQQSPPNINNLA